MNRFLEAEMSEHLGYEKHHKSEQPNKRNGKMRKTVSTELGDIPRDRDSSFEPQLVKNPAEYARKYKGKQPNTKNYEKILKLLDNGLGYKDIKESLGVSGTTIANAKRWRNQQIKDKDKGMIPMFTESNLEQSTKVVKRGRKPFL